MSLAESNLSEDICNIKIIQDGPDVGLLKTIDGIFKLVDIPPYISEILQVVELNRRTQNVIVLTKHHDSKATYLDVLDVTGISNIFR